jgi:hypothetical protein
MISFPSSQTRAPSSVLVTIWYVSPRSARNRPVHRTENSRPKGVSAGCGDVSPQSYATCGSFRTNSSFFSPRPAKYSPRKPCPGLTPAPGGEEKSALATLANGTSAAPFSPATSTFSPSIFSSPTCVLPSRVTTSPAITNEDQTPAATTRPRPIQRIDRPNPTTNPQNEERPAPTPPFCPLPFALFGEL